MPEDLDDDRRIFDACPERVEGAAMIFKLPPQFGQCSMLMSKTRLSSRAQLRRAGAPCAGASSVEASVARSAELGMIFTAQLCARCEHAMEADQM